MRATSMMESNEETAEHGSVSILGAERKEEKFHWGTVGSVQGMGEDRSKASLSLLTFFGGTQG